MIDCSIVKQLSDIHNFNNDDLKDICDHIINMICSNVVLNLKSGNNEVNIDVGFGNLIVRCFEDKIIYQFEPSLNLKNKLEESITTHTDPLTTELKVKIDRKLQQLYKELLK